MGVINKLLRHEAISDDFFDLLANHDSHYGQAPGIIKASWIVVSKVIVALAANYEEFRNYGEYMYLNCVEKKDGTYEPKSTKAKLLHNVLLFLGELPLDTSITYGDGVIGRREFELRRLMRTSYTKEEQLLCLELMVARCWFDLFIKKIPNATCRYFQYLALEYMYWECSIDSRLSVLWENLGGINDPVHQEDRELLYYSLFKAQRQGLLTGIFEFLNEAANDMPQILKTSDYRGQRSPKPIKKRHVNGVLVGFNANSASMRGVRGRPGPLIPKNLKSMFSLDKLLDHVLESYPIRSF